MKKNKIDIKKFKKCREIGQGRYGIVYESEEIETKNLYAVKLIFCEKEEGECDKIIEHEFSAIIHACHPTIIRFIGYSTIDFDNKNNIMIFMKLAENGSLSDIIKNVMQHKETKNYTNTIRQIILVGVSLGMKYLHDCKIIHGDLKPENVLLNADFHPLITDFGISRKMSTDQIQIQSQSRSKFYQAPEILKGENYNEKVDVYSFGILMYEVLNNSFVYPELINGQLSDTEFKDKIINDHYRPDFTIPIKKNLQQLIERCLSENPNDRPSFGEIFEKLTTTDNDDYLLDDVNIDELNQYVNEITESNESTDDLLNKIRKYENDIKNLKKQNLALKTENYQTHMKMDKMEQENQQLKEEICYLKDLNKINEIEKQQLNNAIKQLQKENKSIDSTKESNKKLKSEIEAIKEENKKLKMMINNNSNKNEQQGKQKPVVTIENGPDCNVDSGDDQLQEIFGKFYEKRSNLEHEFRQFIYDIEYNSNEILYLFQENKDIESINVQINELFNKFKIITQKIVKEHNSISKKNEIILNFYKNDIKSITNLQQSVINKLYPLILNIPSEFKEVMDNEYDFYYDYDSLFQSFKVNVKNVNLFKLSIIEPPKNYDLKIKNEELIIKYDKFVCIINMIVTLREFIKFEIKYNRINEESSKEEQQLLIKKPEPLNLNKSEPSNLNKSEPSNLNKSEPSNLNKSEPSNLNRPEPSKLNRPEPPILNKSDQQILISDDRKKIEKERKKIEDEKRFIKEEKIKFEEKKKQFDEKMKKKVSEEEKMSQKISTNIKNKIDLLKKDEEQLRIQKEQFEKERNKFIQWKTEIESLVITDKQFVERIDALEKMIISLNVPNPLSIYSNNNDNDNPVPTEASISNYIDKIKDLNYVIAKIKSEIIEITAIGSKYMMNYAVLVDENAKIIQFMQSHNLHYKSDNSSPEKKQCNIY